MLEHVEQCLKTAAEMLGSTPTASEQRQVARLFESLGVVLPKVLREQYATFLKSHSMYVHLNNQEKCLIWVNQLVEALKLSENNTETPEVSPLVISQETDTLPVEQTQQEIKSVPVMNEAAVAHPQTFPVQNRIQRNFVPQPANGTLGTPANYRLGVNRAHSAALARLHRSASLFNKSTTGF